MGPEETCQRAVRVRLLVGELMMAAMDRDPARRRFLQAGHRDDHHRMLQPFRAFQAAMGEQPVVAKVDAEQPAQMRAHDRDDQAAPAEIAGQERQQREGVVGADPENVGPVELIRQHAGRQQQSGAWGGLIGASGVSTAVLAVGRGAVVIRGQFHSAGGVVGDARDDSSYTVRACTGVQILRLIDAAVCRENRWRISCIAVESAMCGIAAISKG